jgi:hypothetical protein
LFAAGKIHLSYQCISDPDPKCNKTLPERRLLDHQAAFFKDTGIYGREGYHRQSETGMFSMAKTYILLKKGT